MIHLNLGIVAAEVNSELFGAGIGNGDFEAGLGCVWLTVAATDSLIASFFIKWLLTPG